MAYQDVAGINKLSAARLPSVGPPSSLGQLQRYDPLRPLSCEATPEGLKFRRVDGGARLPGSRPDTPRSDGARPAPYALGDRGGKSAPMAIVPLMSLPSLEDSGVRPCVKPAAAVPAGFVLVGAELITTPTGQGGASASHSGPIDVSSSP